MLLWQAEAWGLKGFPFISDSARHLATPLRICASVTCFLVRVQILCHRTMALWAGIQLFFFGCWFNGCGGYWWAAPRLRQNSFKSWLFWCLPPPTRCGVITSSSRAAPLSHLCSAPRYLHLSVLINVSAVREGGNAGGGRKNISIQSSLQNLSSTKSNSSMTAARLSCTVSKVSVECLTQAVGFLMGLFSQRLTWQRLFSP